MDGVHGINFSGVQKSEVDLQRHLRPLRQQLRMPILRLEIFLASSESICQRTFAAFLPAFVCWIVNVREMKERDVCELTAFLSVAVAASSVASAAFPVYRNISFDILGLIEKGE